MTKNENNISNYIQPDLRRHEYANKNNNNDKRAEWHKEDNARYENYV